MSIWLSAARFSPFSSGARRASSRLRFKMITRDTVRGEVKLDLKQLPDGPYRCCLWGKDADGAELLRATSQSFELREGAIRSVSPLVRFPHPGPWPATPAALAPPAPRPKEQTLRGDLHPCH